MLDYPAGTNVSTRVLKWKRWMEEVRGGDVMMEARLE